MNRNKFPETVPFRLTRMLVKAMEVCSFPSTGRTRTVSKRNLDVNVCHLLLRHVESMVPIAPLAKRSAEMNLSLAT
jgi:hypothetical protein